MASKTLCNFAEKMYWIFEGPWQSRSRKLTPFFQYTTTPNRLEKGISSSGAVGGKTSKTSFLLGFSNIERGNGSSGAIE